METDHIESTPGADHSDCTWSDVEHVPVCAFAHADRANAYRNCMETVRDHQYTRQDAVGHVYKIDDAFQLVLDDELVDLDICREKVPDPARREEG